MSNGSKDIQLQDLIADYPSIDDPDIQKKLTAKWEFAELETSPEEIIPKEGDYYRHQKLVQRFMMEYDRLAVLHDTGTGKSFLIGAVAEALRKRYVQGRGIRHILILVKGGTQETDIKKMLICKATGGTYLSPAMTGDAGRVETYLGTDTNGERLKFKQWITIRCYESFSNEINQYSDEELSVKYRDHLIIIDEFHNLRIGQDENPFEEESWHIREGRRVLEKRRKGLEVYANIWRLCHIPPRIKVMGLSASLITDDVNEAGSVLNLILPLERQFPQGTDFYTMTTEMLRKHVMGYVSYVRSLNTGAVPDRRGVRDKNTYEGPDGELYESQLVLYTVSMSSKQTESYRRARESSGGISHLQVEARQCSNGIYPDGTWGAGGFPSSDADKPITGKTEAARGRAIQRRNERASRKKWIEPFGKNWYRPIGELKTMMSSQDTFRELSTKGATVIDIVNSTPGIVVIYDEFVKGSGLIYLALAMEQQGYERFSETESIFSLSRDEAAPYCSKSKDARRSVRPTFESSRVTGRPRFAMIADVMTTGEINTILETLGSYENRYGDYIKVVMISNKGKEGISINNALAYIQYGGAWHPAAEYQASSRVFRAVSHNDLIEEEIERLVQNGVPLEEARSQASVTVSVYSLAAIPNDPSLRSVDLELYRSTEYKNRQIKAFMRKLKILAIDCWIHRKRNIRSTDTDGSPDCDYMKCEYTCYTPKPKNIDYSTYDVYYIDEAVESLRDIIKEYFRKNGSGSVSGIRKSILTGYRNELEMYGEKDTLGLLKILDKDKYVEIALARIILDRDRILDRFGYTVYLKEDRGVYYTDRRFPIYDAIYDDRSLSYYGQNMTISRQKPFDEVVVELERGQVEDIITELETVDQEGSIMTEDELRERIFSYSIDNQAVILENALLDAVKEGDIIDSDDTHTIRSSNEVQNRILKIFEKNIFKFNEPKTEIRRTAAELSNKNIDLKLPPKIERINFKQGFTMTRDTDTPLVYVHNLYTFSVDRSNYNRLARILKAEGKLRILIPSENLKWRDMNYYETIVYNKYLQYLIYREIEEVDKEGLSGRIIKDEFYVADPETALKKSKGKNDMKLNRKGRKCVFFNKDELIPFMWRLGMTPPLDVRPGSDSRASMINRVIRSFKKISREEVESWEDDQIQFYFLWSLSKKKKDKICKLISLRMGELGLIIHMQ